MKKLIFVAVLCAGVYLAWNYANKPDLEQARQEIAKLCGKDASLSQFDSIARDVSERDAHDCVVSANDCMEVTGCLTGVALSSVQRHFESFEKGFKRGVQ